MLKHMALAFLLLGLAVAQREYPVEVHVDDDGLLPGSNVKCKSEVPKVFVCAIFFDVDPPLHNGIDIVSVIGGESNFPHTPPSPVIREISLILNGTIFTAVYDPPLKLDEK